MAARGRHCRVVASLADGADVIAAAVLGLKFRTVEKVLKRVVG